MIGKPRYRIKLHEIQKISDMDILLSKTRPNYPYIQKLSDMDIFAEQNPPKLSIYTKKFLTWIFC